MRESHFIHTSNYRLEIRHVLELSKMEIIFASKINHSDMKYMVGTVPQEWMQGEEDEVQRKLKRFRELHVELTTPPTIALKGQEKKLLLKNHTKSTYSRKQEKKCDQKINFGVKYWKQTRKQEQLSLVFDRKNEKIHLTLLKRTKPLQAIQATIKNDSLSPSEKNPLYTLFLGLQKLKVHFSQNHLILNHKLLYSIPLQNVVTQSLQIEEEREQEEDEQEHQKKLKNLSLFKHIFLTELIAHMIINRFGRSRWKKIKQREGYNRVEFQDEELEQLRSSGYRLYEFRDHPMKWKKKRLKKKKEQIEEDSLDEEELEGPINILTNVGRKIKNITDETKEEKQICNFTFMSGYEKSKINKMRFCLHQMTRETDHTQALMDFIWLVFQVIPKHKLMGSPRIVKYFQQKKKQDDEESYRKGLMSEFMHHFKVKRSLSSCLAEYTKQYFFHIILNIGLRVLQAPYQLIFLRLPFSHIFWSIKLLYHRHKRAIFYNNHKKNKDKIIKLYRGCSVTEKEIKELKMNVGAYIEAEGFLSTSFEQGITKKFTTNLSMVIHIAAPNLKGLFDNGFANISTFSTYSFERQVLVNAFNMFKIISLKKASHDQKAHILHLEYESMKKVEQKVKKSEDLLNKEYLWNVDYKQISLIKQKLKRYKELMSEHWHTKLAKILVPQERKLWKRRNKLLNQIKKEYKKAVKKLPKWQKELHLNTKHQKSEMVSIQYYGSLLFALGEFRKACIYYKRRLKSVELDMAVEGIHWRKSLCRFIHYRHMTKISFLPLKDIRQFILQKNMKKEKIKQNIRLQTENS